ncbi:cation diffusion facilitator family transporter [Iamia majanohamensis]|uniref:Cation diffusion facilitator family transporter n=1 Tax=Iamia majanohamensis TaxID=467976 RepID=A0AAF0BWE6_9ACTN|nr:cation diffusion facilitator family transporter [Iamia majanohamensis]WCO67973.1 cation diffusion facilitator family transporter [Iamia majanohamensis]
MLHPHSHDPADSVDSALDSSARGIRAVRISFVALMITAAAQVAIVALTGSVALLADTIHNFSDALTAIPLLIAFRLGRRAPTRRYTYGYGRAEDLAGVFVVLMIAISAAVAAYQAFDRLVHPRPLEGLWLLFAAGLVGSAGNELVALYRVREGRAIGSAALVADGYHARTDGLTSLAVAGGAVGVAAGFERADALVGLAISVAILGVLWGATRQIYARLMDAVDPDLVAAVEEHASRVTDVAGVDGVHVRWIGHRLSAELTIDTDPSFTVASSHQIADDTTARLRRAIPHLDAVHIHVHPASAAPTSEPTRADDPPRAQVTTGRRT